MDTYAVIMVMPDGVRGGITFDYTENGDLFWGPCIHLTRCKARKIAAQKLKGELDFVQQVYEEDGSIIHPYSFEVIDEDEARKIDTRLYDRYAGPPQKEPPWHAAKEILEF